MALVAVTCSDVEMRILLRWMLLLVVIGMSLSCPRKAPDKEREGFFIENPELHHLQIRLPFATSNSDHGGATLLVADGVLIHGLSWISWSLPADCEGWATPYLEDQRCEVLQGSVSSIRSAEPREMVLFCRFPKDTGMMRLWMAPIDGCGKEALPSVLEARDQKLRSPDYYELIPEFVVHTKPKVIPSLELDIWRR